MRPNFVKSSVETALRVTSVLLLGVSLSVAQVTVNLTATPQHATLPDGQSIPMWGLVCTPDPTTHVVGPCTSLHFNSLTGAYDLQAGGDVWQPPLIIVPSGQNLQINLTNNLSFTPTTSTTPNNIPTSLVIVGQLGGGLGSQRTTTMSPDHSQAQGAVTWPIAGGPGVTPTAQAPRVQSLATEVVVGTPTALTWTNPRPGTYLIESGTHPSIQGPMGLYGILVVTTAPANGAAGTAYGTSGTATAVSYNADVPLLMSEIDPRQNKAVDAAVHTSGFTETAVWSGQPGKCGDPQSPMFNTCYPPAVNYTPLYYLINGVAFDKTHAATSLFAASPGSGVSGNVLVRLVNAGLRMHVPSIVGSQSGTAVAPALPPAGFSLIAEDGNPLPGVRRIQSEVFMAAGKTYDVMINVPSTGSPALPIFDRELSLSGNAINRDAGMLAYIGINGSTLPTSGAFAATTSLAAPDSYFLVAGNTLTVSDVAKGVLANDVNVFGVKVQTAPVGGTLTLNLNGTFTYIPTSGTVSDSFQYCGNGTSSGAACAVVTLAQCTTGNACLEAGGGISMSNITYTSNVATHLSIAPPGVLSVDKDAAGYPLKVAAGTVSAGTTTGTIGIGPCGSPATAPCVAVDPNGGFSASVLTPGTYTFNYNAQNSQGTMSTNSATVTLVFPTGSGLAVTVLDAQDKTTQITDYRWIIEEDKTFYINPLCTNTTTAPPPGCPTNTGTGGVPQTFGVNFHTSYMPVVAQGCTGDISCGNGQMMVDTNQSSPTYGSHVNVVCDVGNGVCRPGQEQMQVDPKYVHLDPTKRYYISIEPGDAADPFEGKAAGHGMGGAPITFNQTSVTVLTEPTPLQPAQLSVFVFEDDNPLNGEHDAGGGVDVLAPNEPGLGGFEIILADDAGGTGDSTGQPTYDMFNMPLTNSLSGQIDPATGMDACPIAQQATKDPAQKGIVGMIVTCPTYEADGLTLSPLAGQAVINNLYPGRYGVSATPAADRIARGEEWLQTNTLDGQKAHDAFLRVGEPNYFQEFGPAGYHVSIGFANPAIINGRLPEICAVAGANCNHEVKGTITTTRMSRIPDERLFSSGSRDSFSFTQCYVSIGDTDGADFAIQKCDPDGNFDIKGLPSGNWRITPFDQWNDQLVDGLSVPVALTGGTVNMGDIPVQQWQANIYTQSFFDQNGNGIRDANEQGLTLVPTNIRFRDGSYSNLNNTDLAGNAGFNEVFPLFNWYVIESDSTRYKTTGTHVVYDSGGPADGGPISASTNCSSSTSPPCGSSGIGANMANTYEANPLPAALHVPGALYCDNADCTGTNSTTSTPHSTGRIDPPWVASEGWQGFSGQNSFLNFGKKPFAVGENGGIHGHVIYASTRPFDDPQLLLQLTWEPMVPHVTVNLYQEGTAADGTQSLKLVDTTQSSSWDDWAQGFRSDNVPNMNCPGQSTSDLFFFSLFNQTNYLNPGAALPNNSQFKCYDGMHNWNQLQPAPYDGMYQFPSSLGINPQTGKTTGTNCHMATVAEPWGCVTDPDSTDPYRFGVPMLKAGKYVVEMVVPSGYELVKEEDKNILIGDNYIAPVTQQFGALGSIFIIPDQAAVNETYNKFNAQNSTTDLGVQPRHEGDTGSVESFWPCVGAPRTIPDYLSLFPQAQEVSPFAGATRNLCDRKEITLEDQSSALAKFYIFTSTHVAAHFTGVITDDFTSEFDPFSPAFGEKFAPPNLPISVKDFAGNEIARTVSDHWGAFNGLNYSTWEVNPPNPTGYAPQVMVYCMNDPGSGATPDPLYNPGYSQFCYETPFMPGQTQYMDTPVIPTSAFSEGYNHPDCAYPDATPAISSVTGDVAGPWVSAAGHSLTINGLSDQQIVNYGYSGPQATAAPFNLKTVNRHFGFGPRPSTCPNTGDCQNVKIGGVPMRDVGTWTETQIVGNVPAGVSACSIQQPAQYGGPNGGSVPAEQCGELVITAANGRQSVDTVTVTVGGKNPAVLAGQTIQSAIDAASPGDLIIVPPGTYNEILLMWKPVRLQGVGAASSIINANTHPAGKMDPWRRQVNCLFGLALNGQPSTGNVSLDPITSQVVPGSGGANPYDSSGAYACPGTGWSSFSGQPNNPQVDRIPLEGILGWDATVNGNLAEQLQEPTLMGAYEGAGITVLAKGVRYPAGVNIFGNGSDTGTTATESQMPLGTVLLTDGVHPVGDNPAPNPNPADCTDYPSNFLCSPSRIDGLSISNSSQGGGGIFVHGWAHHLEVSNNRIQNNTGTLSGGINIGQGETPDGLLVGNGGNPAGFDQAPGSCQSSSGLPANLQLPYCYNTYVSVHNNGITNNSSIGDELFSGTPAGAGGATLTAGSDWYSFQSNFVCGNVSSGDGGGLAHLGFNWNGDIERNTIIFNQSTNPTIPTNGGGIIVMGAAPDGTIPGQGTVECGSVTDVDCAPGLSNGTGPNLVINANLIQGNGAESGSGGGIRLQTVNGSEIANFANPVVAGVPMAWQYWNSVSVTNNIIANNVAGWDGGGISLQDALKVDIVNNTIVSNDATASSGVLFNTNGAPNASTPPPGCDPATGNGCTNPVTFSRPQVAGLVTIANTPNLTASLPANVVCPPGHSQGALLPVNNGTCRSISYPVLYNDIFWQNRTFNITVGGYSNAFQQNLVSLVPVLNQPSTDSTSVNGTGVIVTGGTGACVSGANYWDIGVRGDSGPGNHGGGATLNPANSVLTSIGGYGTAGGRASNNSASDPQVQSQYCNGSRVPPENGGLGYQVPPGIADGTVPNPIFNLTPSATVDEGNNWINMSWGPLGLTNPTVTGADGNYGAGAPLGSYALASTSPAIDVVPYCTGTACVGTNPFQLVSAAPATDFFGNPRPDPAVPGGFDVGATEFQGSRSVVAVLSVTPTSLAYATRLVGTTSAAQTLTLRNSGGVAATGITIAVAPNPPFVRPNGAAGGNCGTTLNAGASCSINIVFSPTTAGSFNGSVTISAGVPVIGSPVTLTGTAIGPPTLTSISPSSGLRGTNFNVTLTGTNLTGTTAIAISGGGITAGAFTVNAAGTQITTTFTISNGAGTGNRNVTVTANGATSNAVTFSVAIPTLTSISPVSGLHNTTVNVTLNGTNLTGTTAVNVSGNGITVGPLTVSANQITTTFTIANGANRTSRNVTVVNPNYPSSSPVTFTVQ